MRDTRLLLQSKYTASSMSIFFQHSPILHISILQNVAAGHGLWYDTAVAVDFKF